jgi:hypothetical protein
MLTFHLCGFAPVPYEEAMRKNVLLVAVLFATLAAPRAAVLYAQDAAPVIEPSTVPAAPPEVTFTLRSRLDVGDVAIPRLPIDLIRRLHEEASLFSMDLTTEAGHGRLILRFSFADTPAFEAWYVSDTTRRLFEDLDAQSSDDLQMALFVKRP